MGQAVKEKVIGGQYTIVSLVLEEKWKGISKEKDWLWSGQDTSGVIFVVEFSSLEANIKLNKN